MTTMKKQNKLMRYKTVKIKLVTNNNMWNTNIKLQKKKTE